MNSSKHAVEVTGSHPENNANSLTLQTGAKSKSIGNSSNNGDLKYGTDLDGETEISNSFAGRKRKYPTAGLDVLKGVSVCLTGFSAQRKTVLHRLVAFLGGSFNQDLLIHETTHLIANPKLTHEQQHADGKKTFNIERSGGEKIREALKHKSRIEILTPDWVEMCKVKRVRVPEYDYRIFPHHSVLNVNGEVMVEIGELYLEKACDMLLEPGKIPLNPLFSACYFFLVGFSENNDCYDDNIDGHIDASVMTFKKKLLCLVRRCMGTILWDLNECITHVVVNERCDPKLMSCVQKFCRNHSNCPTPVSPQWVIASLNNQRLVKTSSYPPTTNSPKTSSNIFRETVPATRRKEQKPNVSASSLRPINSQSVGAVVDSTQSITGKSNNIDTKIEIPFRNGLFGNIIFHIVRQTPTIPPLSNTPFAISFDLDDMEKVIASHGGKMLCQSVIDELVKYRLSINDKKTMQSKMENICYVLNFEGTNNMMCLKPSSLISKIQDICKIVYVTPIWVQTCLELKVLTPPGEFPSLFQPVPWPLRRLPIELVENFCKRVNAGIKVAVTGFQGAERIGISRLLVAMGASYTETMSTCNTHLICKEAVGQKFKKAVEWGLYVVTVDWLFHVAKFGYNGCCGDSGDSESFEDRPGSKGCEDKFYPEVLVMENG